MALNGSGDAPMVKRLALVEDDDVIRENYAEILRDEGFEVATYRNRRDALQAFEAELPDLVLLDIGLDEEREGGFRLCSELRRKSSSLPIIFLTSHGSEVDKISGMRLGADDYLVKDVGIEYLVVRIQALLNRIETLTGGASSDDEDRKLVRGRLRIDLERSVAYWDDQLVDLTLTQFWMLQELARDAGQVKGYERLMRAANITVEPNTVSAHIKTIRDRFRALDPDFQCIRTERSIGYRWLEL